MLKLFLLCLCVDDCVHLQANLFLLIVSFHSSQTGVCQPNFPICLFLQLWLADREKKLKEKKKMKQREEEKENEKKQKDMEEKFLENKSARRAWEQKKEVVT